MPKGLELGSVMIYQGKPYRHDLLGGLSIAVTQAPTAVKNMFNAGHAGLPGIPHRRRRAPPSQARLPTNRSGCVVDVAACQPFATIVGT